MAEALIAEAKPPKFRRNRQAREQALITAAVEVFAARGYDAATTREIGARAGCSEGLITHYFGGKEGLLAFILEERMKEVEQEIYSHIGGGGNLADEIREYILFRASSVRQHPIERIRWSRALVDPAFSQKSFAFGRRFLELNTEGLRRSVQAGKIRPDADLESAAALIGVISSFLGLRHVDEDATRRLVSAWSEMISRDLAPRDQPPR